MPFSDVGPHFKSIETLKGESTAEIESTWLGPGFIFKHLLH
jgi:hypothetical protein